ncbi:60S ribosomal protein L22 [archaeon]|nr:MAG: 60S ribosomal protein L22 [archaeon]
MVMAFAVLAGCGGGGGSSGGIQFVLPPVPVPVPTPAPSPIPAASYSVGGAIDGLSDTVVLRNNDQDDLSLKADGPFVFPKPVAAGSPYAVSIAQQPRTSTCTVDNGQGTVTSQVVDVRVACTPCQSLAVCTRRGGETRPTAPPPPPPRLRTCGAAWPHLAHTFLVSPSAGGRTWSGGGALRGAGVAWPSGNWVEDSVCCALLLLPVQAAAVKSVKTAKGAKKTKYVIDAAEAATDKILAVADLVRSYLRCGCRGAVILQLLMQRAGRAAAVCCRAPPAGSIDAAACVAMRALDGRGEGVRMFGVVAATDAWTALELHRAVYRHRYLRASRSAKQHSLRVSVAHVLPASCCGVEVSTLVATPSRLPFSSRLASPTHTPSSLQATFLSKAIKVDGKAGALAGKVEVKAEGNKVTVETSVPYAKRYFKYLAKKYLKKQQLSEYLRVVANSKTGYQLRYFKINDEETE